MDSPERDGTSIVESRVTTSIAAWLSTSRFNAKLNTQTATVANKANFNWVAKSEKFASFTKVEIFVKIHPTPSCKSQSALRRSASGRIHLLLLL